MYVNNIEGREIRIFPGPVNFMSIPIDLTRHTNYVYYSNFDKHKCSYFHWAQCNEPTTLALGNLRCFSLISTKFAVVIATVFNYRFNC